ncbi:Acyltransferase family protein [Actinomadura meyerae]|uniref:Acyltransferase family protein n=1 Tax=Actinomadura meyerae TaxID=240840 RepID=A0A239KM40_9ACTN|nr:acyltransferase [Actinomadura meyerae]SNT19070.1 Acyltransferase family protein [Actinomadura meyerae]
MLDARPGEAIVRLAPVPERDHAVDALRVLAILGVVLGHWLVTALVAGPSGRDLHVTSPLKAMPYLAPISWVFQTLAVFFLVGGYAAAKSRRPGEAWGTLMRRRLTRFARPLPVLALAWIPAAAALRWAGFSSGTVRTMVELVLSPLWFLCVYAVLTACGPLVASAWDRFGWRGAALLVAATAAIDLGRFALDTPGWTGWATVLTAWLLPFYLGTGWARGALRSRRSGFALLVGGTAATALLVLLAGYPASMVGVPGAAVSNLSPPTLAAVAFGLAQTGLAVLLHGPLTRWTRHARVRALLDASGVSAMTVYLWHQTALMAVTVVTLLTLGNLQGVHTAPGGPEWIMMRLPWLAAFAAVLVVLRTVTGRFETGRFETDRFETDRAGPAPRRRTHPGW